METTEISNPDDSFCKHSRDWETEKDHENSNYAQKKRPSMENHVKKHKNYRKSAKTCVSVNHRLKDVVSQNP